MFILFPLPGILTATTKDWREDKTASVSLGFSFLKRKISLKNMKNHPSWVRGIQMDTQYTHFYAGKSTYCCDSSSLIYKRLHALFSFLPSVFREITSLCFFLLPKRCPEKKKSTEKVHRKIETGWAFLYILTQFLVTLEAVFLWISPCFFPSGVKKGNKPHRERGNICLPTPPSFFLFLFPFLWQPFCLEGHHQYFPLLLHLLSWIIISRWNTHVKITVIRAV